MQIRFQRSYVFIGAEAVVTKDVPDYALMLGNPAKVAGWMFECIHQIKFQDGIGICDYCGKQYRQNAEEISRFQNESLLQDMIISSES